MCLASAATNTSELLLWLCVVRARRQRVRPVLACVALMLACLMSALCGWHCLLCSLRFVQARCQHVHALDAGLCGRCLRMWGLCWPDVSSVRGFCWLLWLVLPVALWC